MAFGAAEMASEIVMAAPEWIVNTVIARIDAGERPSAAEIRRQINRAKQEEAEAMLQVEERDSHVCPRREQDSAPSEAGCTVHEIGTAAETRGAENK